MSMSSGMENSFIQVNGRGIRSLDMEICMMLTASRYTAEISVMGNFPVREHRMMQPEE